MTTMNKISEIKFLDKIDCNFPYLDNSKSQLLIEQASNISYNAIFAVIEEICRIPYSERQSVSTERLLKLLNLTASKLNHPLKEIIVDVANKMINDKQLSVEEAVKKMEIVKNYPGQYSALSILYFSCDDNDKILEPIWDKIINEWKNNFE
jgi:hypothetical protein